MTLLLDTHIVLWWLADDAALAESIKDRIDEEPAVYVSAATIWEVTIKQALGKLGPADLPERILNSGLLHLPITAEHGIVAGRLPLHHRDPFDRMLVAQAQVESLTLVSRDAHVQKYDVGFISA